MAEIKPFTVNPPAEAVEAVLERGARLSLADRAGGPRTAGTTAATRPS